MSQTKSDVIEMRLVHTRLSRLWFLSTALLQGVLAVFCVAYPAFGQYFLNQQGYNRQYSIVRFGEDGLPDPFEPVVMPSGVGFDTLHLAWPSAVQTDEGVLLYAAGYDGKRYSAIGLWLSPDGRPPFQRLGPVLEAGSGEPYGLGMATVVYDPEDANARFKMWYSARGRPGIPDHIVYASSDDGRRFVRHATVLRLAAPEEAAGFTVDYVCRRRNGDWVIFYMRFPIRTTASAAVAVASSPDGPFRRVGTIFAANHSFATLSKAARERTSRLSVGEPEKIAIGDLYVLYDEDRHDSVEAVQVVAKQGSQVLIRPPLAQDHARGAILAHIAKQKISPSFAREHEDGTWSGVFTGFGHRSVSEFTFPVKAPALEGPWEIDRTRDAPVFKPILPEGVFSTENPEPLRSRPDC